MDHLETDILVIGAGGAGLRAALSARESAPSLRVTVVSRGTAGKHGVTAVACSDRMAFHVSFPQSGSVTEDFWMDHARDIYEGGGYVSDPNLADLLARESPNAYHRLAELGVPFALGPGNHPRQFVTDGSKVARACYTGPYTARDIEHASFVAAKNHGISFLDHIALVSLIKSGNPERVCGALFINEDSSEFISINARAVILATGGPGEIYRENVYPGGMDALGWFAALNAGASLVNIEFIQFGLASPATSLACSGSLMRALPAISAGGRGLLTDVQAIAPDENPIELLFNKGASWPVSAESPSRAVDIAVWRASMKGETVRLDYRSNPGFGDEVHFNKHLSEVMRSWYLDRGILLARNGSTSTPIERLEKLNPQVIHWFMERGIDLHKSPIDIRHAAQHFQGGILINTKAETGVPGLFACGEAAGGQHGANRPGGNALLDCQVMGHVAGVESAQWSMNTELSDIRKISEEIPDSLKSELDGKYGIDPNAILKSVREIMYTHVGVMRTPVGGLHSVSDLEGWKNQRINMRTARFLDALTAHAAAVIGLGISNAAVHRRESRGANLFFRDENSTIPIPRYDPEGRIWNVVRLLEGHIKVLKKKFPKRKLI